MKALHSLILTLIFMYHVKAQDCTTHTFVNPDNILKYATFSAGSEVGSKKLTFSRDSFLLDQKYYKKLIVLDYDIHELTEDYFLEKKMAKFIFIRMARKLYCTIFV